MISEPYPAVAAFQRSGLTHTQLQERGRVSWGYFLRLARNGAPYHTALRLAHVLGCSIEVFLRPRAVVTPSRGRVKGATGGRTRGTRRKGVPR